MRLAAAVAATLLIPSLAFAQDAVVATAKVTVTGGPNAGTQEKSASKGGCSVGLAGPGAFGVQLSDSKDKDKAKLNSVQVIVADPKGSSGEFYLMVAFGSVMARGAEYIVDTQPKTAKKKGSGKVTVQESGGTAKITFSATTAEGVKLDGTIDCKGVARG